MRTLCCVAWLLLWPFAATADIAFERPPSPSGGLIVSSWVDPNGSDADLYAYDEFMVGADATITEVRWRGGYTQNQFGGPVTDFSVTFFDSIAGGSQPHVGNPQLEDTAPIYLAKYWVGGNAGETLAGTFGGTTIYEYQFALPTPFHAVVGTKYWLRIEASQSTYPDWGIAVGTGGDGTHYQFSTGAAMFQFAANDTAFTLFTAGGPTSTPTAPPTATVTITPTVAFTPTHTATVTPTSTVPLSATPTNPPPPSATASATTTATATASPKPCVGDCNRSGQVTVDEILTMVNIALGNTPVTMCEAGDANHDNQITVDEILAAANNALNGCVPTRTPTPTPAPGLPHGHTCCQCPNQAPACVDFAWVEVERACPLGCTMFADAECEAPCHPGPQGGPAQCIVLTPCTTLTRTATTGTHARQIAVPLTGVHTSASASSTSDQPAIISPTSWSAPDIHGAFIVL